MKNKDSELIQRTLDGDQSAFTTLVEKYQKGVHALVWQKIGDFHIAQEITQDAFLKAYQNLETLKNHNLFSGWLYVIATRLCYAWCRKKRISVQSLETLDTKEVDKVAYSQYIEEQRETDADDARRELVRNLLKKLPESERTVMTLHYLGEMSCESISEFLGVSSNTIRSRLSRARNRLKKEEAMIKENLSYFQLPSQMTENIMKKISQLTPTTTPISKPFVPWVLSAASSILVLFLLGIGMHGQVRYQQPYSLEAASESTIEIVDAQIVMDTSEKPANRPQIGQSNTVSESQSPGQTPDASLFASAHVEDNSVTKSNSQWVQTKGPVGGAISTLFSTTNDVYAGTLNGLYRLSDDRSTWKLINTIKGPSPPLQDNLWWWPVAERKGTLYLATDTEILKSTDRGDTWETFCDGLKKMDGWLVGMVLADGDSGTDSDVRIYIAYTSGVFRTDDFGKTWTPLPDGMIGVKLRTIGTIQNTVFVGTHNGLFRLKDNVWEQVSVDSDKEQGHYLDVSAIVATEKHLYVAARLIKDVGRHFIPVSAEWSLYHSEDMGDTWHTINPKLNIEDRKNNSGRVVAASFNEAAFMESPAIRLAATGDSILIVAGKYHAFTSDTGQTWTKLGDIGNNQNVSGAVLLTDGSIYRSGLSGIHQTTIDSTTWHTFNAGLISTFVHQLYSINSNLYGNIGEHMVLSSSDTGETWTSVAGDADTYSRILEYDGNLYAINHNNFSPKLYRLSEETNSLQEIPNVPDFGLKHRANPNAILVEKNKIDKIDWKEELKVKGPSEADVFHNIDDLVENIEESNQNKSTYLLLVSSYGSFAVSPTAYFVEYNQRLFRWKPGTTEWYDTGLIDKGKPENVIDSGNFVNPFDFSFKLSVLNNDVYVGTRDGRLMHSTDAGNTWEDVTAFLPFAVDHFKDVIVVGQAVYVATNKGVARSINGTDWQAITNTQDKLLFIERLAVDGSKVYGLSDQIIYQFSEHFEKWQQVTPAITQEISTFDVDGNTIYIGTSGQGVFTFTLNNHTY